MAKSPLGKLSISKTYEKRRGKKWEIKFETWAVKTINTYIAFPIHLEWNYSGGSETQSPCFQLPNTKILFEC